MRGHEEASGTKYVPKELMNYWVKKDPIVNYEYFLMESGIDSELLETFKKNIRKEINIAVKRPLVKSRYRSIRKKNLPMFMHHLLKKAKY